jgi:small-conductance mechanosensitive channel
MSFAEDMPGMLGWVALTVSVVIAAILAHWALNRTGRALGRRLASAAPQPAKRAAWEFRLRLALLALKIVLWGGVAWYLSDRLLLLWLLREAFASVLAMGLGSPLFEIGGKSYSTLDLLELPAILAVLWVAVSAITRLIRSQVLGALGVERGVEQTVTLVLRLGLTFLGAIVILQAWGIDVSSLAIVASVLGVGVGFGLQNIANNFVSGLVIGFERPIRPGDFVNLGELCGTVERIGARSTEIRTLDNVSILVPNSRLLENEVVNWSYGDPVARLHLPVGVAYGSDIARVRSALLEAARSHPQVLADPRPRVEFHGFGESSLDFELLVWTRDPRSQHHLKSDLYYRLEANLRRHRIQIPFPQRDLHLRSPAVDAVLTAWARQRFSAEELAAAASNGHPAEAPDAEPPADWLRRLDDDVELHAWSEGDIDAFVARMRGPGGVPIRDRRYLHRVYPSCFVGSEAVDWMVASSRLTRSEAIKLGELLVERRVIHHVLDELGFRDGKFFYRFRADE